MTKSISNAKTTTLIEESLQGVGSALLHGVNDNKLLSSSDIDLVKKSEAHLNTILNHADSGYVLYNSALQIIAYNALAQHLSQMLYSKALVEGNHLLMYFPKERHELLLDITNRVLAGEKINYELAFEIDGQEKWFDVGWLNVKNAENKNWGFILASKDITERKREALKLEKTTNDLMRRNKTLEQFANVTSHNLRAPVANIVSLIKMMEEVTDEAEKKQLLEFILLSSQNLNLVISDIHHILEIKQHLEEVKENIYFEQLVNDIKISISYLIMKEQVTIRSDFSDVQYIYSVKSFIHGIFYNLILNSIKYRRPGVSPEVDIIAKRNKNNLILTIADNGKGIDLNKHRDNIFGLYKRFDTTVEGSGLGLYMIKSQVEELGGTITVESELGKGTRFIVELPL
jgi:PAS domain S-box-containing protein